MSLLSPLTGAIATAFSAKVETARPANSTTYNAGDVIGAAAAAIEFPFMGVPGSNIIITDATLRVDVASIPSGMTNFRLHLYSATPPSALADNAIWDLPAGDRNAYLGYIDLGSPADFGSTLYVQTSSINRKVKMGASPSLFGYLVTNSSYTPTASAVKAITLAAVGA